MKILGILKGLGKKLITGIPGSGIIKQVKDTFSKEKPDTWAELGFYVLGVLALWMALYFGVIKDFDSFIKGLKAIF